MQFPALVLVGLLGLLGYVAAAVKPSIRVLIFPTVGIQQESDVLLPLAQQWSDANGIDITIEWPQTLVSTDYAAVVSTYLKTHKPDYYDIYMIDVVWTGDYADFFVPLDKYIDQATLSSFNQDILRQDFVKGKHVALPWYADYGIFYYRQDLLDKYNKPIPETWDEVEDAAKAILKGERIEQAAGTAIDKKLYGYLGQLDAYEGLTCNVVEWVKSVGRGDLMDAEGHVTVNNEGAKWIFNKMRSWINDDPYIIPGGSMVYREQTGLDDFAAGYAIFMRNWPFCIKALTEAKAFNNTARKWGFKRLPGRIAGQSAGTLGGWHLAISNHTQDEASAVKVLKWLTSPAIQKARAINHGLLPTDMALFQDQEVCTAIGHCDVFGNISVAARPSAASGGSYLSVSQRFYTSINEFLSGKNGAENIDTVLKALTIDAEKLAGTYIDPARGPPVYVDYESPIAKAMLALYGIGLILLLAMIGLILHFRDVRVVRTASPFYCIWMIIGAILCLSTLFVYTGYPTKATCILQPWMLAVSFATIMTALLERNWIIFRIFNNPYLKVLQFSPWHFWARFGSVLAVEGVIIGVWTGIDPPQPTRVYLADYNYITCRSSSSNFHWTMTGVLLAANFLLLVAAMILGYFTKHVRKDYNDAQKIALIVWNTTSFSFIALALIFIEPLGVKTIYAIRSLIIWECNMFFLGSFFGPLLNDVARNPDGLVSSAVPSNMPLGMSINALTQQMATDKTATTTTDELHMPKQKTSLILTGILVGKTAQSKIALSFSPWNHFMVVILPDDGILSIMPEVGSHVRFAHLSIKLSEYLARTYFSLPITFHVVPRAGEPHHCVERLLGVSW
ncbi:uncharacterized protein EV422DRAFT_519143 [Fimicolochytrium jonesii]|uniref:uncharacterized protein n=1 Tax=Fimicolochytrium jonesii TaxID=1396493 RepID=UPI0022FE46F8|nr:uncharacterized protein EV422DRAFT_519143 [Fimicolochytrium jonesii]KAI8824160.1 hypothetical protein EV422DRAFT_519143 [Fimicolochytrium jonesii]